MRESERRVEEAASSHDARQQLLAQRVLSDATTQRLWETEHSRYMHLVADPWRRRRQIAELRKVAFALIHRKALFEYLRDGALRGEARRRVFALFHGSRSYTEAVVAEHQLFTRSALSHLCATHIGTAIAQDPAFDEAFVHYERLYLEYLRLFCEAHTAPAPDDPAQALLPYLKYQITAQRQTILALEDERAARPRPFAVVDIGDTVRMRRPV